jgi:hypothetical protein
MRKGLGKVFTGFFVLFLAIALADVANAQNRRGYSKEYVEQLLERIEERSDDFTEIFDEALDRSRLDTTSAEEDYTDSARALENATDELRREFDFNDTRGETSENVRKVLTAATVINRIIESRNFGAATETSWKRFRAELNELAKIHGLPSVGSKTYRNASVVRSASRRENPRNYNRQQIESLLERIEERTDAFTETFDETLDDSALDRTRAEEDFTDAARNLENATDELRREFDHDDSWAENAPEARKVLFNATIVDRIMKRRNFGRTTENAWQQLRAELNSLAKVFNIPGVGSNSYR